MMKDAADYLITFPYGATTTPYSKDHPHPGEDRKMPERTPIPVNGQVIGLSGNSGKSTGAHLHIQRVVNGKVVRPVGGGFTLPAPVVVTDVGFKQDIGNYIRLKDGNGEVWSYFHLYEIKVKMGDKIGANMTKEQAQDLAMAIGLALLFSVEEIKSPKGFNFDYQWKHIQAEPYTYATALLMNKDFGYNSERFKKLSHKASHYDADLKAAQTGLSPEERAFIDAGKKLFKG